MPGQATEIIARWGGGLAFEAVNARGASVRMDSPSEIPAVTPMEMVLMALAGCTGMDTADILRKKRQQVRSMEIRARGTRAEDHPRVYAAIELEYIVTGTEVSEDAVARSIELSMNKYCAVGAMLAPSVPIKTSFRIIADEEKTA